MEDIWSKKKKDRNSFMDNFNKSTGSMKKLLKVQVKKMNSYSKQQQLLQQQENRKRGRS